MLLLPCLAMERRAPNVPAMFSGKTGSAEDALWRDTSQSAAAYERASS